MNANAWVFLAALLFGGCSSETAEQWRQRCAAAGGHDYSRGVYKGTLHLCLTPDGRVIELGAR